MSGMLAAAESGLTACKQDLIDASVVGTFIVSRHIECAPLHLHQDMPVPFQYRKHVHFPNSVCLWQHFD